MTVHVSALMEQHQRYKAAQSRLWGVPKKLAKIATLPEIKVEVTPPLPVKKPLWQSSVIEFDHHVTAWRDVVRQCLETLASSMSGRKIHPSIDPSKRNPQMIVAEVLEHFPGVTARELKGPRGPEKTCIARQIAMYEIKMQRPDLSFVKIGRLFGGRDHSTVHHAIDKIATMVEAGVPIYPIDERI